MVIAVLGFYSGALPEFSMNLSEPSFRVVATYAAAQPGVWSILDATGAQLDPRVVGVEARVDAVLTALREQFQ